jgi:predicted MPP superfamily phosphohydrolase
MLAIVLLLAFYNGLVTRNYSLLTDKLASGDSVRIILIADLHNHIYRENQSELVALIEEQNPDLIALAGDIADDQVPIAGTEQLLDGIKDLAPIYYVSGNHEFWSDDIENIKAVIRRYGVTVLENTYDTITIKNTPVTIAGVDDPEVVAYEKPWFNWEQEMLEAFADLQDKPEFTILLAHRPERIQLYKKMDFDLVLSGHAHGGQVRIPLLLNGLYSPNQGWFPEYAGGSYKHDSLTQIVSRGLSYNPRLPRIFNPPEIVVIDLEAPPE